MRDMLGVSLGIESVKELEKKLKVASDSLIEMLYQRVGVPGTPLHLEWLARRKDIQSWTVTEETGPENGRNDVTISVTPKPIEYIQITFTIEEEKK